MSTRNLIQQTAGLLAGYFEWVKDTLASDTARRAVLADLGLDPANPPPLAISGERITSIDRYRTTVNPPEQAFLDAWQDVLAVVEIIEGFVDAAGAGARGIVKETTRQFINLTATEYVRLRHPKAYYVARLLALIEDRVPEQFHRPVDTVVSKDIFRNLLDLLEQPVDHFDRAYSTPETEDDARRLAANTLTPLGLLLAFWEQTAHHATQFVGAEFELPERNVLHGWDTAPTSPTPVADRLSEQVLSFAFEGLRVGAGSADAKGTMGATLAWVPREHGGPGLYVSVTGAGDLDVPLGSIWKFNTKRETSDLVDVLIWDTVDFRPTDPGPVPAPAALALPAAAPPAGADGEEIQFTFQPVKATPEEPYVLTLFGTRVEIGELAIVFNLAEHGVGVELVARHSALVLRREDGDGFISRLLPEGGARLEFDLGITLTISPEFRVSLEGGSGLQATIPVNRSVGPARLQQLYLELASGSKAAPGASGLRFETSLAASTKLGPITAAVDRVGFEVVATDTKTPPDIGFKAPSGVGLVIDTAVVTGGGYLFHDAVKEQYAGVVQLEFKGLTLQAIGLITTRLPSGRRGFSLLVVIAASDFAPINLGFGFTLTGVGGVIGYNRTVDVEPLRAGLKTGALDTVLFPENPVQDAPRIVSALETIMPPREDQYVVGPMARISWGVPTLLTIDLGIVLEGPSPTRLVVLGQLRAVMPRENGAVVRLQMDALGVVDFDRGDVAIDAVLYDSQITRYPISGDMALRARFGDDPTFALAVGGLHPKFSAPSGFPKLNRVTVGLTQGPTTQLTLQAYLALTSNTAQIGARLDFRFTASAFSVEGAVGFDALFQFSPFSFLVDLHAGVTLKWHGRTLLGVDLDVTLAGPSPWHVRGKATFKLWRFSKSVSFDRTLGEGTPPPALPPADPMPELLAALADPRNWSAQVPPAAATMAAVRDTGPTDEVLLHPLAELTVRQRVVPLGVDIDRFGSAALAGDHRFDVTVLDGAGRPAPDTAVVEDHFAPAQFLDLTDDEKLLRPSFERMGAGVRVTAAGVAWGGRDNPALIADVDVTYETVVLGASSGPIRQRDPFAASAEDLRLAAAHGAVARATTRHTGPARYRAPRRGAPMATPKYTIVKSADLSSAAIPELPVGTNAYTVASQALERHLQRHPEQRGQLQLAEVNQ